jgi:methylmalonyl-CoA/ethylmalonyl-CoA epimerase
MFRKLEHVGIIVKSINKASKIFRDVLHLTPWDKGIVELPEYGIKVLLFSIGGNHIELIEPTGTQNNRFSKFLKEKGEGLFHITIETEEFDAEVEALRVKGFKVEVENCTSLFLGSVLRLGWLSPETAHGVWIEIADLASVPKEFKEHKI